MTSVGSVIAKRGAKDVDICGGTWYSGGIEDGMETTNERRPTMFWCWFDELCMIIERYDVLAINNETLDIWSQCPFTTAELVLYNDLS